MQKKDEVLSQQIRPEEQDLETGRGSEHILKEREFSKGQKAGITVLIILAVVMVVLWTRQFKKSISGPFEYQENTQNGQLSTENSIFEENSDELYEESLKDKDTDKDGLSDWEELNFYETSPYLEDSDSDGFSDKEETDSNNNPNCPAGQDCYDDIISEEDQGVDNQLSSLKQEALDNLFDQLSSEEQTTQESGFDLDVFNNLDAAGLRQMLIDAGMDQRVLDQISDEELMESFSEIMAEDGE